MQRNRESKAISRLPWNVTPSPGSPYKAAAEVSAAAAAAEVSAAAAAAAAEVSVTAAAAAEVSAAF